MGPKERERRFARQRVDRRHKGIVVRQGRPPTWTTGEKAVLVLFFALAFALAAVLFAVI